MFWQFAIDVGGTFTDCIATSPDGSIKTVKVLSSGVCKGFVEHAIGPRSFSDSRRQGDSPGLWNGSQIRFYRRGATNVAAAQVSEFDTDSGTLQLDRDAIGSPELGQAIERGDAARIRYELSLGEPAPLLAIRQVLGLPMTSPLPPLELRLGTTRGTNALLTRRGAVTAFVTTAGFGDILTIGYQNRPRLFDLEIRRPPPLYAKVLEIDERIGSQGEVLESPAEARIREQLLGLREAGIQSVAICLMNAYINPLHEIIVERIAQQLGFDNISTSHRLAPLIKLVERGQTTVIDAYLNPVLYAYLAEIGSKLVPQSRILLMTSSGDLVSQDRFSGKDSLLSGPAGGVVGLSGVANCSSSGKGIGFDMGGTSTDVSRFDGRLELQTETQKAGVTVFAPTLSIETVAAGGGSVCWYESGRLRVGPQSSGADPGPACYGRGGPLSVTDLNVWLGRVVHDHFPFDLDLTAIERQLGEWQMRIGQESGKMLGLDELAVGWLRIANVKMAEAIRSVSIVKGYDPRLYSLIAFGGAAAQHVCSVADELNMTRAIVPRDAAVLSAVGMRQAQLAARVIRGMYRIAASGSLDEFNNDFAFLEETATRQLADQGCTNGPTLQRMAELRYLGTEASLLVEQPPDNDYLEAFQVAHQRRFGYRQDRDIEVCSLQVQAADQQVLDGEVDVFQRGVPAEAAEIRPIATVAGRRAAGLFSRDDLRAGNWLNGPALVYENNSTIVVDAGWELRVLPSLNLELQRSTEITATRATERTPRSPASDSQADPILLEIFANQFQAIAEQMGATLRNTASSVNVKERLDFSCALFDPDGNLVVNAPHIPVHLGAMSETVRCLIRDVVDMRAGDAFLTNDPYLGGSHLPDLTVVSPAFIGNAERPSFFVASRAHHAEIGGKTPGSMPPFSKTLGEEGVIFRHFQVADASGVRLAALRDGLRGTASRENASHIIARFPSRAPEENIKDIHAQLAANLQGIRDLDALCARQGLEVVLSYMKKLQHLSRCAVGQILAHLGAGTRTFTDLMDDGSRLQVTATISNGRLTLDFTGTCAVHAGNLNANRGIVTAAVLYVLRCLLTHGNKLDQTLWTREMREGRRTLDHAISTVEWPTSVPLNHGLLELVDLVLPAGLLNPTATEDPAQSPAVVGGNVETSQRVVDVLLAVFGIAAASQGTMNNLLFGDASFGYYETLCGGAGATCFCSGSDAFHTHMTNTRITDPEVLESRFPVRLRQFAIRHGSGGAGEFAGGNGVIRELQFLKDLEVTLLSNRRSTRPFGLAGGEAGESGRNQLGRPSGSTGGGATSWTDVGGSALFSVSAEDLLRIETPGGGGFGPAAAQVPENGLQREA